MLPEPTQWEESARSATSSVPPASAQPQTAFLVLRVKSSTKEDAGRNAPLFPSKEWAKMLHAQIPALTDSTKFLKPSVLLAPLNAPPAQDQPETALHASTDQSQSTDLAQSSAERTSSASEESAWPALRAAMDAQIPLRTVFLVPEDTSRPDQSARRDVFLISSSMLDKRDALPVDLDVPLAQPSTSVPLARTLQSAPEEESAPTAPTPVPLVMELELALHASADSSTSKDHARPHALTEPPPSTESANANQESSPSANA